MMRKTAAALLAAVALAGCSNTSTPTPKPTASTTIPNIPTVRPYAPPAPNPGAKNDGYDNVRKAIGHAMNDTKKFWYDSGKIDMSKYRAATPNEPYAASCSPKGNQYDALAWVCPLDNMIVFNLSVVKPRVFEKFGVTGVYLLTGKEMGRAGLYTFDPTANTGDDLEESRTDCLSGAFMRAVVDGKMTGTHLDGESFRKTVLSMYPDDAGPAEMRRHAIDDGYTKNSVVFCANYGGYR